MRLAIPYILILLSMAGAGCNKLVEVPMPSNNILSEAVFESDAQATAAVNDIYTTMSASDLSGGSAANSYMSFWAGLSADEFQLRAGLTVNRFTPIYRNDLTSIQTEYPVLWMAIYPDLYRINQAIEGLSASKRTTLPVRRQLLGEMKFMRAFDYFYLVNLYGRVPLVLHTDYTRNSLIARSSIDSVYAQIIDDLKEAQELMSPRYLSTDEVTVSEERTAPNKWTATALLARVQLYRKNYQEAAALATAVINETDLYELVDADEVFLKNNRESIWQLQPVYADYNTTDARFFVLLRDGVPDEHPVSLSDDLVAQFTTNDVRKKLWTDTVTISGKIYTFPFKYKQYELKAPLTEYQVQLRLAEQYLIRAEALAQLGQLQPAVNDLDSIRNRAGIGGYAGALDGPSILAAIRQERRLEFFSEYGHRWLDLKRWDNIAATMTPAAAAKGGSWQDHDQWYPVPLTELRMNPFLIQTDGY